MDPANSLHSLVAIQLDNTGDDEKLPHRLKQSVDRIHSILSGQLARGVNLLLPRTLKPEVWRMLVPHALN